MDTLLSGSGRDADWVSSNELVLTTRMFVLRWTRPGSYASALLPLRDSAGIKPDFGTTTKKFIKFSQRSLAPRVPCDALN